jgi:hypothetical protein
MPTAVSHRYALPADVRQFAQAAGLERFLDVATRLAETHFKPGRLLCAEVQTDPETDERSVVIDVSASGTAEEVLRQNEAFTREWIAAVPAGARSSIRVLYRIA